MKCSSGDKRSMAKSMPLLQRKRRRRKVGCKQENEREMCTDSVNMRFSTDKRNNITRQKGGARLIGQVERKKKKNNQKRLWILTGGKYASAHSEHSESQMEREMWIIHTAIQPYYQL